MASDEGPGASKEHGSVSDAFDSTWKDKYITQSSGTCRPAVVLLACDSPNEMQSDIPLALHTIAELPIISYNVNAALTLKSSQILITAAKEHVEAVQQVVQKAYPHEACSFIFIGVDASGQVGEEVARRQRQRALDALAEDITEVVEWPSNWYITREAVDTLVSRGREKLQKEGAECYSINVAAGSGMSVSKAGPHPSWATAGFWRKALQGNSQSSSGHFCEAYDEAIGKPPTIITNRWDLREVEHRLRVSELKRHLQSGVTFRDSDHGTHLSAGLHIGRDTVIGVGVQIYGKTVIGRNVSIEGPTVIKDSVIGDNCRIGAFSHLDRATLASGSGVGPFARMRAGAAIDSGAYIGNFVELKGAHVGQGGNVCHLSYLGDADVGERANIGAGTITCNYNGVAKNRTTIAADAFIGSNSTLVAPVTVGQGALIAAGSVVTTDVPADALALGRSRQTTLEHRANATREKLRAQEEQKKSQLG